MTNNNENSADRFQFKNNFKRLRKTLGWSQSQTAEKLGFTPAAISHFETGRREPTLTNFVKICEGFNVSPNVMLSSEFVEEPDFIKRLEAVEKKINDHVNQWQIHNHVIGGLFK